MTSLSSFASSLCHLLLPFPPHDYRTDAVSQVNRMPSIKPQIPNLPNNANSSFRSQPTCWCLHPRTFSYRLPGLYPLKAGHPRV
ncbi:hypothetical protein BJX64DRAFT_31474 [Aspergillus heterothallicus]